MIHILIKNPYLTFTCTKSSIETLGESEMRNTLKVNNSRSDVFIVNCEHVSHLLLLFLLLTMNK